MSEPFNVIPGYILSKPRHTERAKAEHEIAARFMGGMAVILAALPEPLAREGILIGFNAVKYCELREGTPANDIWMKTREMVPCLAWLSLQVKHPQITLEQTCELITQHNGDEIALATWQLWGLIPAEDRATVHLDVPQPAHASL